MVPPDFKEDEEEKEESGELSDVSYVHEQNNCEY